MGLNSTAEKLRVTFFDSSKQLEQSDSDQILYLLAEIKSPAEEQEKKILPLNIVLVIDRSTSMQGERIDKVKAAASMIVEKLSSRDSISIVSFSDRAEIVVSSTQVKNKPAIVSRLQSIIPSGGTEIFQGLAAGVRELKKVNLNNYVNHLILLTDGHTYGDDVQCIELAMRSAQVGIGISAFGIGDEWNDHFLDSLVSPSGGQSGYIAEPEQVIHLLKERIQSLGSVYAKNVRLIPNFDEGIIIRDGFKLTPFSQPIQVNRQEIQLGAIEGHTSLSILFEILIDPSKSGQNLDLGFEIKAEISADNGSAYRLNKTHLVQFSQSTEEGEMAPLLVSAVQLLNLYRMNENIWQNISDGEISTGTKKLDLLTRRFKEAGLNQLAQAIGTQTRVLRDKGEFTESGRMQIKYGTRMQLTSTLQMALTEHQNGSSELVENH